MGSIKIVDKISVKELEKMSESMYSSIVKADVDIVKSIIIVDMAMHADGEAELLAQGSRQDNIWGINLHPLKYKTEHFVEFDSMINLKPRLGNLTNGIDDDMVRQKIISIVEGVVHE